MLKYTNSVSPRLTSDAISPANAIAARTAAVRKCNITRIVTGKASSCYPDRAMPRPRLIAVIAPVAVVVVFALTMRGAAVVAVGTESFRDPRAGSRVAAELESSLLSERSTEPALDLD